jgi:putative spermidine/putrescine transport system substrate-binding protein
MINHKAFVVAALAGAMWSAPIASAQQPYTGQTLGFATFGGAWQKWVEEAVGSRFTAQTGAKVEYVPGNPQQFLAQMIANKGQSPPFDLAELSEDTALQAARLDLVDLEFDPKFIPNLAKLAPRWQPTGRLGPVIWTTGVVILYAREKLKAAGISGPVTWDTLSNPALKGHVAIPDIQQPQRGIWAAINKNKTGDETDFRASLEAILLIQDPIIYSSAAALQTRYNDGGVWAIVGISPWRPRFDPKADTLAIAEYPVGDKKRIVQTAIASIPKGTARKDLAEIFINTYLSVDVQLSLTRTQGAGATNLDAEAELKKDPALAPLVISSAEEAEQSFFADWERLTSVYPQWVDQWNRAMRR